MPKAIQVLATVLPVMDEVHSMVLLESGWHLIKAGMKFLNETHIQQLNLENTLLQKPHLWMVLT